MSQSPLDGGVSPSVPQPVLEPEKCSVIRKLEEYFIFVCAECILRTYPARDESFQLLSPLVDYGYVEYQQRSETRLTELLIEIFPGCPWEYEGTDYGVTQETLPVRNSAFCPAPPTLQTPRADTHERGPTRAAYYLSIPWSKVHRRVAYRWFEDALRVTARGDPFFLASVMQAPPLAAASDTGVTGTSGDTPDVTPDDWQPTCIFHLPIEHTHQVWKQRDKARRVPWVSLQPQYLNYTSVRTAAAARRTPASPTHGSAAPPIPHVQAGRREGVCNALYHPFRVVLWRHGSWHATTPSAGREVTDCLPGEIAVVPSCDLIGLAEYHRWAQWDPVHEELKRELTPLVLGAVEGSILIIPPPAEALVTGSQAPVARPLLTRRGERSTRVSPPACAGGDQDEFINVLS